MIKLEKRDGTYEVFDKNKIINRIKQYITGDRNQFIKPCVRKIKLHTAQRINGINGILNRISGHRIKQNMFQSNVQTKYHRDKGKKKDNQKGKAKPTYFQILVKEDHDRRENEE